MAEKKVHPLKAWRVKKGLGLVEAAKLLDTSASYLSEIENLKKGPSLAFAKKLRDQAGISLDRIAEYA
jgi:transcriptional regulator with XRE-family HTH domain